MSEINSLKDVQHWRQLVKSKWLRGADLDPNRDTIATIKSIEYTKSPGEGIDDPLVVIKFMEPMKPYGTQTVENLRALAAVYGTDDPNKWTPGQKIALYSKNVTAFGETAPAVRIRHEAPQFITAEQVMEIEDLLAKGGKDRAKFLAWARVGRLEDVDAKTYRKARQMLDGSTK